jgi:hypothetical protein
MANPHRGAVAIEIGGKPRTLKIDLNALAEAEDRLKVSGMNDILPLLERVSVRAVRCILWVALIHEDPDLTEQEVGSWTMNLQEVVNLLTKALGVAFTVPDDPKAAEGNGARPLAEAGTGKKSKPSLTGR